MISNLTFLVPTRNRPDQLGVCLESIKTGFGEGQRVIIGDNGEVYATTRVISRFPDLDIEHLQNPEGTGYIGNLNILFAAKRTDWFCVIHDDDFFNKEAGEVVGPIIADPDVDFIFTDHWFCDNEGNIDTGKTAGFHRHYGRDMLFAGLQKDPGALAAGQSIALDGFFMRASLAAKVPLGTAQSVAMDMKWLIETMDCAEGVWYSPERIFTYRLSEEGLTATGDPLKESRNFWEAMRATHSDNPATRRALAKLRRRALISVCRSKLSRLFKKSFR